MGAHHSSTGTSPNEHTDDDFPMEQHGILSQYKIEHRLFPGSGRMMKTYHMQHKTTEATAVVKAIWVDSNRQDRELRDQREELERIKEALKDEPHVAPFSYWIHQTEFQSTANNIMKQRQPVYLLRPHLYTTLSDRLASRPFFTPIEKLWMVHQILQALEAMHQAKVCHGFLTTENVGLTSWNWVVLLDISSYKARTQLPDDDPSEYMYYFQDHHHGHTDNAITSKQKVMNREKRCYIAPERFASQKNPTMMADHDNTNKGTFFSKCNELTPAMDMFSAGCVIMELWLNGDRALDLGDLMDYRRQSTLVPQLQQKLNKIESSALRAACRHMVQLDPTQRLSARAYIERLQASDALPKVMEDCLEPLLRKVSDPKSNILTPDARLALAALNYEQVLWETVGVQDTEGAGYLKRVLGPTVVYLEKNVGCAKGTEDEKPSEASTPPVHADQTSGQSTVNDLFAETEALLKKLDSLSLGETDDETEPYSSTSAAAESSAEDANREESGAEHSPQKAKRPILCKNSLLIYLQLILANIRHVQRPTSKLVAIQLLARLCDLCDSDEIRLQRMVPVSISLLQDQDTLVRAAAIKFLTYTVSRVQSFPPSDSKIFPQYIFKRVSPLLTDPSLVVRLAFCQSIVVLAETAHRFLDITHAVRLYEAIGGGAGSGVTSSNAHSEEGIATSGQSQKNIPKHAPPTDSNVFGDDVAKLLGGDNSKDDAKGKDKDDGVGHDTAYHGRNPTTSPTGKTLISSNYKEELASLQETVSRWVVHITTDPSEHSSPTKRALLDSHLSRLCTFFGLEGVMAFILPQILAFLNDRKDHQLRTALFCHITSVCRFVGRAATEHFVLPCLETGLVDSEEQVVAAAVRCLAELIELGLISRSVLLGNLNLTPTADSVELSSDGLLRKYGALLLHPSAAIRYGAIATVNAACLALGSPDSEVYVAHILYPYLRFQPSLKHLQTADGLKLCLYPSWSREKFDDELSAFVHFRQHQSDGTWTSIRVDGSDRPSQDDSIKEAEGEKGNVTGGDETEKKKRSGIDAREVQIQRMKEYLRMIGRRRQPVSFGSENNNEQMGTLNNLLKNGIEGSLKLAQNIKFPRQDTFGENNRTLPLWYSSLRDKMQGMSAEASETSAIRSVSALGQIYGLSIMAASDGTSDQIGSSGEDYRLSEEEIRKLLNSTESKVIEAVSSGEWGSETRLDPVLLDTSLLITKLKALHVPPLPPRLGELNRPTYSRQQQAPVPVPRGPGKNIAVGAEWKPKADTLLASSSQVTGHIAPVVRIAVSLDQNFFVTGSYDGTCRAWELQQIESCSGILDSSVTYNGHSDSSYSQTTTRINDLAMVEGSHSVVSAASNGSVHVWRVDLVPNSKQSPAQVQNESRANYQRSRVIGTSEIREVNPEEGEVLAVSHFNSPSASIVTYATQKGSVHSWDLRSCLEPFTLKHGPDIGYLTSMALGTDRNWILTGTSRGYVALWDLRFNQTVKLWHHSREAPITRLATSFVPPPQMWSGRNLNQTSARPFVFAACGPNECAMFDVATGECRECFRTVGFGGQSSHFYAEDIPKLYEVPISALSHRRSALMTSGFERRQNTLAPSPPTSINAMCGSIGVSDQSYLITGGGDARIRFWDFAVPAKCYVVSGQSSTQPRPSYERMDLNGPCRLLLCRQAPSPSYKQTRGAASKNKLRNALNRPENHHTDAIQDLKIVNNALISASRDCTVKVWR